MTAAIEPTPREIKLLVLSGTWEECHQWMANNRKSPLDVRWVTGELSLVDVTYGVVIRTGTWKNNRMATSERLKAIEQRTSEILRHG